MPKRPRQHSLEDISINRFKALLPEQWVCREKSHDYGIDLEVEIFDDGGNSTGLLFFVQLKATDNHENAQNVQISNETLKYYQELDIPTIIVRYSHSGKQFYWTWMFEAWREVARDTKSTTVHFAKEISETFSATLSESLVTLRLLKANNQSTRFPLDFIATHDYHANSRFLGILDNIFSEFGFLRPVE